MVRLLSADEVKILVVQWKEAFAQDRQGARIKDYLWHIFAAERHPNVSGAEALSQYEQQEAPEYLVMADESDLGFATVLRPQWCSLPDYYVFAANFAWTMAFTHEDGWCGPYFARHRDYAALNDANLAAMRKAREREEARLKGWG